MTGFNNPIVGGGGALVYPSIHSPNFSAIDETGWSINKDGTVDFSSMRVVGGAPLTVLLAVSTGHDVGELSFVDNGTGAFYLEAFAGFSVLMADPISAVKPGSSPNQTPEIWHDVGAAGEPAFQNSFSSGGTAPRFQLEPVGAGRCRLSGAVNTGAITGAGATIFTLPAAYRPSRAFGFVTPNNVTAYALGQASVQIDTSGDVQLVPAGTAGKFVLLDGICFELD